MGLLWFGSGQVACAQVAGATPESKVTRPATSSAPKDTALSPVQKELDTLLQETMKWRSLDKATIIKRLEADASQATLVNRGPLHEVLVIKNPAKHPGSFFFRGDELVLITLGATSLEKYSDADVEAVLKGKSEQLPSTYGKASMVYAYPDRGVSFTTRSQDGHKIQYIELFPPRTLEAYKQTLYPSP